MSDQDMIDENELLDLFARRRPDPERIAAGIAERIAPRSAGGSGDAASGGANSGTNATKAAAWLPLPLKGSKIWLWLSMPMLLLAAVGLSLTGAASSITKSLQSGPQPHSAGTKRPKRSALQSTGCLPSLVFVAAAAALPLLGWYNMLDQLLIASLVSMFSLAHLVRRNVRNGYGDRQQMAAVCVSLLDSLLFITLIFTIYDFPGVGTSQWTYASPIALGIGTLAFVRYVPAQSIIAIAVAGYLLFLSQYDAFRPKTREVPATLQQVMAFVEKPDLEPRDTRMREYRTMVLALRAAGETPTIPAELWDHVTQATSPNVPRDAFALSDCSRADLAPEDAWQDLAERRFFERQVDRFLERTGPLQLKPYHEYLFRLIATRDLSTEQREQISRRLMASWPSADAAEPLTTCRLLTAGLDLLGRKDLADSQRELVHAALVRTQTHSGFSSGGFSESQNFIKPTCNDLAMALMARFGVPEKLDLHALRGHLERTSMMPTRKTAALLERNLASYALLLQFDKQVGEIPSRDLLRVFVDERMLWAMIAMILLCIYTVCITPAALQSDHGGPLRGAMP